MSEFKSEIAEQAKRLNRSLTNGEVAAINAEYVRWADKEISVLRADLGRALARVAELSSVMRSIIDREQTGEIVHRCQAALDNDNSVARDLRKQAEAVEAFGATTWTSANRDSRYWLGKVNDYAQRLRQQADEAKKAGG